MPVTMAAAIPTCVMTSGHSTRTCTSGYLGVCSAKLETGSWAESESSTRPGTAKGAAHARSIRRGQLTCTIRVQADE